MTARQYRECLAFYELEPFGEPVEWQRAIMIGSQAGMKKKYPRMAGFLPPAMRRAPLRKGKITDEEIHAKMRSAFPQMKVVKRGDNRAD